MEKLYSSVLHCDVGIVGVLGGVGCSPRLGFIFTANWLVVGTKKGWEEHGALHLVGPWLLHLDFSAWLDAWRFGTVLDGS